MPHPIEAHSEQVKEASPRASAMRRGGMTDAEPDG
jgi:hypothetical protein